MDGLCLHHFIYAPSHRREQVNFLLHICVNVINKKIITKIFTTDIFKNGAHIKLGFLPTVTPVTYDKLITTTCTFN